MSCAKTKSYQPCGQYMYVKPHAFATVAQWCNYSNHPHAHDTALAISPAPTGAICTRLSKLQIFLGLCQPTPNHTYTDPGHGDETFFLFNDGQHTLHSTMTIHCSEHQRLLRDSLKLLSQRDSRELLFNNFDCKRYPSQA